MVTKVSNEEVQAWKEAYESGTSLYDLEAMEAAKNRRISHVTIRKWIVAAGGVIRTYAETVALQKKKRMETLND